VLVDSEPITNAVLRDMLADWTEHGNQEKRIRFPRLFALRNVPPRPVRNLRLHEVGRLSLKRVPNSTAPVPVPFTSRLSLT
jgi:hypothetical protein